MLQAIPKCIWVIVVLLAGLPVLPCCGQGSQPDFEVASINPGGDVFSTKPQISPGRIVWTTQFAYLVAYAYDLEFNRVSGAGLGVVYSLNATFQPGQPEQDVRRMLQSLLQERFKLRFHRMTKDADGLALIANKGAVKLKKSTERIDPECSRLGANGASAAHESYVFASLMTASTVQIKGCATTLAQLSRTLERVLGEPFWDQTGLQGKYNFEFSFSQEVGADSQAEVPALATALQESLGLSLHRQKGPIETLVIDHVERPSAD